jgi:hypothetical protein
LSLDRGQTLFQCSDIAAILRALLLELLRLPSDFFARDARYFTF